MRYTVFASVLVGLLASLFVVGPATAQTFDHLKCYKVKDSQKFKQALVDLTPLSDPPFALEAGCTLVGKAKKLCTPVDKAILESDIKPSQIEGPELSADYLCYKIKCPKLDVPDLQVADQFGSRTMGKFKAAELCVPAPAGATTVTTTTVTVSTTLPYVCPLDGSPVACDAFPTDPCLSCCSASTTCSSACSDANSIGGCTDLTLNDACNQGAHAAGCVDECCRSTTTTTLAAPTP